MLIKLCNTFIDEKHILEKIDFSLVWKSHIDYQEQDISASKKLVTELGYKANSIGFEFAYFFLIPSATL